MAGAFDTRALAAFVGAADDPVAPETLDVLEFGWKYQTNDLSFDLASFYYKWEDKQTFDLNNEGNPAFLNIPKANVYGFDGDLKWRISDNWQLNLSTGSLQSEIVDAGNLRFTEKGKTLSHTPRWSHAFLLSYFLENKLGESSVNLSHRYKSQVYDNNANTEYNVIEAQALWNISMKHQFKQSNRLSYSIEAGVENISGEKHCHSLTDNASLSYAVQCRPNVGNAQWYLGLRVDM